MKRRTAVLLVRAAIFFGLLVVLLLAITACSPDEGTVLEKQYIPDRSYYSTEPLYSTQCSGSGSNYRCQQVYRGTQQVWHYLPDCWQLLVRDPEGKARTTCVHRQVYADIEIGEYWRRDAK